ncbi:Phosphatidylinositol 4-kinase [Dimargaris cristalligena]|nr:Phosphatidylinositol 4-kinase [Dimargaris cristalligena]
MPNVPFPSLGLSEPSAPRAGRTRSRLADTFQKTIQFAKRHSFLGRPRASRGRTQFYSVFKPLPRDELAWCLDHGYAPPTCPTGRPTSAQAFAQHIHQVRGAIGDGVYPDRISQGSSGSYFCRNQAGTIVGVFKPKNEEPYGQLNPKWTKWFHRNLCPCFFGRSCLIPNSGYLSESAASLVDQCLGLNIVPRTEIVLLAAPTFHYSARDRRAATRSHRPLPAKMGSFQLFLEGYTDATRFLQQHPWTPAPSSHSHSHVAEPPVASMSSLPIPPTTAPLRNPSGSFGSATRAMPHSLPNYTGLSRLSETAPLLPDRIGRRVSSGSSFILGHPDDSDEDDDDAVLEGVRTGNAPTDRGFRNQIQRPGPPWSELRHQSSTHSVADPFQWTPQLRQQFREELEKLILFDYLVRNTAASPATNPFQDPGLDVPPPHATHPHLHIAAIDNGLAFPFKHPDEWRSYPYAWLSLPSSLVGASFSTASRAHFLPLLTSPHWWHQTISELKDLARIDPGFNLAMFNRQMAVMKGQAWNIIRVLRDGRMGPLDLADRPPVLVNRYDITRTTHIQSLLQRWKQSPTSPRRPVQPGQAGGPLLPPVSSDPTIPTAPGIHPTTTPVDIQGLVTALALDPAATVVEEGPGSDPHHHHHPLESNDDVPTGPPRRLSRTSSFSSTVSSCPTEIPGPWPRRLNSPISFESSRSSIVSLRDVPEWFTAEHHCHQQHLCETATHSPSERPLSSTPGEGRTPRNRNSCPEPPSVRSPLLVGRRHSVPLPVPSDTQATAGRSHRRPFSTDRAMYNLLIPDTRYIVEVIDPYHVRPWFQCC